MSSTKPEVHNYRNYTGGERAMAIGNMHKTIDVKNINLQIKNIKNHVFFTFIKNILKDMHKKHQTTISIQVRT